MKKPLLITFIILLGVGAYLLYNHFNSKRIVTAWDLVPEETVLVYENGICEKCVQDLRATTAAELVRRATLLHTGDDSLKVFQDLATSFTEPTLISLHIIKRDEFDFTYYVNSTPAYNRKLQVAVDAVKKSPGARERKREFNNITINELELNKKVFSWIEVEDVWVGSFNPVLIEDVIRTHLGKTRMFKTVLGNVYNLHSVKNDGGNFFLNFSRLSQWLSVFSKDPTNKILSNFANGALLDAKVSDDKIILTGFSGKAETDKFLSSFGDQSPVQFGLRNVVSNRSLIVSSVGISNAAEFYSRMKAGFPNPSSDSLALTMKEINVNLIDLLAGFSGELATCWLEGRSGSLLPILILHDNNNLKKWTSFFQKISETKVADTVFVDNFSSYRIFEIPRHRFLEKLFHPLVSDNNYHYYAQVNNNAICFAEDIEELKSFLSDIDQENTWGKSVAQNKFLESTLLEANVSLFINTPRVWSVLENSLQPKWRQFVTANMDIIGSLGMGAIQFSHLNGNYYTNVSWSLKEPKVSAPPVKEKFMTVFDNGIASMTLVDSHLDKSKEILIQDSAKNLTLLSSQGKIQWKIPLDGFIQGGVYQIDYLANNKLQYFFCTPGYMHVVDRLGNYVKPYPIAVPEKRIEFVSVLDYDKSKKYRFMITSLEGNLWIYDKEGKNLEGWQPRRAESGLIAPATHHRLLGKDYMAAVRKNGTVLLFNRRGELIPGFPLDLNARLAGDYFIERGRTAAETVFNVVSVDGNRIKFNLQGKVLAREVLVKRSLDAKFSLCRERDDKSYVIARHEPTGVTIIDEKLNELFTSEFASSGSTVRFTNFGNGRSYITLTDKHQELSFIHEKSGKLVNTVPIESNILEIQPVDNGRLKVYTVVNNAFSIANTP